MDAAQPSSLILRKVEGSCPLKPDNDLRIHENRQADYVGLPFFVVNFFLNKIILFRQVPKYAVHFVVKAVVLGQISPTDVGSLEIRREYAERRNFYQP